MNYTVNFTERAIEDSDRLVYRIYDTEVVVLVISAYGHYDDK